MAWQSIQQYRSNSSATLHALGQALSNGELALFLGAGISVPFGLPDWKDLILELSKRIGVDVGAFKLNTKKGLLAAAEKLSQSTDTAKFRDELRSALYSRSKRFTPTELVFSILTLLSGNAKGKVNKVVTLNFDDILESCLLLSGYDVQVVSHWPQIIRDSDVTLYHPHGFVPRNKGIAGLYFDDSDHLVLTEDEFRKILSERNSIWRNELKSIIKQKIILAIGLSPGEPHIFSLFAAVRKEVNNRPLVFWMMRKNSSADMSVKEARFFDKTGAVPICLKDFDNYAEFIFSICSSALQIRRPKKISKA